MSSRLPARLRKLPELPPQSAPADWPPTALPADAVEVGQVLAPRGVQGQFRVRPHAGSADVLLACPHWFLRLALQSDLRPAPAGPRHGQVIALDVEDVGLQGDALCARSATVTRREDAERLQRAAVFIARSDFPALPQGQYYWADLIGLRVVNRDGVDFGAVRDLMETGPSQALVVIDDGDPAARQRLIPFVDAWVDRVDLGAGRIVVCWEADY